MSFVYVTGKINFNPPSLTKKHISQSEWKSTAVIEINDPDICYYYRWFIKKRHNLELTNPRRGAHITFVSDRKNEIKNWKRVYKKYQGKTIRVLLDLDMRTDGKRWWMSVADRDMLHEIRKELGLGRPYYGLHMTIGNVKEKQLEHGEYIRMLYEKGFI